MRGYLYVSGGVVGGTVYREHAPRLWTTLVLTVYVLGVGAMFVDSAPDDYGAVLFLSGLFLVMPVALLLIAPFLKFLGNRIRLTDQALKVGRNVVPVERLAVETAEVDRGPQTPERIGSRTPLNRNPNTPFGYTPVVLYTRNGDPVAIDSRKPDKLVRALHSLAPRWR
ncbi:hypothetical protein KGD82_00600 [Nocardiopsis eucommiae]|uniref:DUF3093 domain-containing protein n=1 Tax=Nocardiopsis eucommiae TaxID=2831970 RepID=A0A975L9B3_9ACTN|nr:hypothetical protein KGD82_00600 [Nocardiopsis eucommiae]